MEWRGEVRPVLGLLLLLTALWSLSDAQVMQETVSSVVWDLSSCLILHDYQSPYPLLPASLPLLQHFGNKKTNCKRNEDGWISNIRVLSIQPHSVFIRWDVDNQLNMENNYSISYSLLSRRGITSIRFVRILTYTHTYVLNNYMVLLLMTIILQYFGE